MAIIYPLSLPTVTGVRSLKGRARSLVAATRSPFTGKAQVYVNPGQILEIDVTLPKMTRAQAAEWLTFLMKLNGPEGTFLMGDSAQAAPRGSAATAPGAPLVNGGGQTGTTINFKGAPNSAAGYLKMMDAVQLGGASTARLHYVLADATSDGVGNFSLDLWPKVTTAMAPADNAPLVVSAAVGLFRLAGNAAEWDADAALHYATGFSAIGEV